MDIRLDGRVLLVTGSTQGVGLAVALEAARSGAAGVFLTGRDTERGDRARELCEASGTEAGFLSADLGEEDAPARLFARCVERFGRVDLLVNAAGLTDRARVADASVALWNRLFAVNARAPFFLMQAFVRHLRERNAPGAAVNILSMNVHGGTPALAVYSASKGALAVATKNAAQAHRFDRIRFNGINMGWADTPAERNMQDVVLGGGPDWLSTASAKQPFGRLLAAEDVARLSTFLLSDASVPMTGALIDQEQWVVGAKDA
jgi:NAD(P)-dependent dehydrogenase (short-subunit alcohol dehydrogenase family)